MNYEYQSLVNLLNTPITPEFRKHVLERLTEINNILLQKQQMMHSYTPDFSKNKQMNTKIPNFTGISTNQKYNEEIDLDDVINSISPDHFDIKSSRSDVVHQKIKDESESLDDKLKKATDLYEKIIRDKKQKKMDKSNVTKK